MFKKLTFVLVAFGLMMTGCSKSDDVSPEGASIVGKWNFSALTLNLDGKAYLPSKTALDDNFSGTTFEFKDDKSFLLDGDGSDKSTYEYDATAKTLVIKTPDSYDEKYTVDITTNTLKLTSLDIDLTKVSEDIDLDSFDGYILLLTIFLFEDNESDLNKVNTAKKLNMTFEFKK